MNDFVKIVIFTYMIKDSNTKVIFTLSKELKEQIEYISKTENRSMSNLIVTVLTDFVQRYNELKNK